MTSFHPALKWCVNTTRLNYKFWDITCCLNRTFYWNNRKWEPWHSFPGQNSRDDVRNHKPAVVLPTLSDVEWCREEELSGLLPREAKPQLPVGSLGRNPHPWSCWKLVLIQAVPVFKWGIGLDNVMHVLWTPTTGFWKGYSINWALILTGVPVLMYKNNTRKRVVHARLEGREARQQQDQCEAILLEANCLQLAFHLAFWFRMDCYCQKMPPEYSFKLTCLDLLFSRWGLFPLNAPTG